MVKNLSIFLVFFLLISMAMAVSAKEYHFIWEPNHPNDEVVEYRLYTRLNSGNYDPHEYESIYVNDAGFDPESPSLIVTFAGTDEFYCFALTAVDVDGYESSPSMEIGDGDSCGGNNERFQDHDTTDDTNSGEYNDPYGCFIGTLLNI